MKQIKASDWKLQARAGDPLFTDAAVRVYDPAGGTDTFVLDQGFIYKKVKGRGWFRTHPDFAKQGRTL